MNRTPRLSVASLLCLLLSCSGALAGTISIAWDPVIGASGYMVYIGRARGEYERVVNVGGSTATTLQGLEACTRYYIAVKSYNPLAVSATYSTEIQGGIAPQVFELQPGGLTQGSTVVPVVIRGEQFKPGTELVVDPSTIPTDIDGRPLMRLDSYTVRGCRNIDAFFSVDPPGRGSRAMPEGFLDVRFHVTNPDTVYGSSPVPLRVDLDPHRLDVDAESTDSRDRVDGADLSRLAVAYASQEGESLFDPDADINGDAIVDGIDLAYLSVNFGSCWTGSGWAAEDCD